MIATEMLGKARASLSSSIASSTASTMASILMSPSSISLSIPRGATPPTRSICSTFPTTSMKSCQIASRNLTSLKSPQIGASAASTSSPCGRKLLRNWRLWVRMRWLGLGVCPLPRKAAVVCLQVHVTQFRPCGFPQGFILMLSQTFLTPKQGAGQRSRSSVLPWAFGLWGILEVNPVLSFSRSRNRRRSRGVRTAPRPSSGCPQHSNPAGAH